MTRRKQRRIDASAKPSRAERGRERPSLFGSASSARADEEDPEEARRRAERDLRHHRGRSRGRAGEALFRGVERFASRHLADLLAGAVVDRAERLAILFRYLAKVREQ